MWAILRKEIASFFGSPVGYLAMGTFLVLSGLFLWVFKGPFNIPDYGFADLSPFFLLAPWVLLLLIPAVCMRTLAEERRMGTLELLLSRPTSAGKIVLGKFLGVLTLVLICLLPTLIYVLAIWQLGSTPGNMDSGLVIGSYLGLVLLAATYSAIGVFASSLTENQIAAFLIGIVLCFLMYYGFESLSTIFSDGSTSLDIANIGLKAHYESISLGVLDSRDAIYFITLSIFFLLLALIQVKRLRK